MKKSIVNQPTFSQLVLSEILEFAEAPSRDELCDILGYFSPVVLTQPTVASQSAPDEFQICEAISFVQALISKNYAFRKYLVQLTNLVPTDANLFVKEWQLKNESRGRIPILYNHIVFVASCFLQFPSDEWEIYIAICEYSSSYKTPS